MHSCLFCDKNIFLYNGFILKVHNTLRLNIFVYLVVIVFNMK